MAPESVFDFSKERTADKQCTVGRDETSFCLDHVCHQESTTPIVAWILNHFQSAAERKDLSTSLGNENWTFGRGIMNASNERQRSLSTKIRIALKLWADSVAWMTAARSSVVWPLVLQPRKEQCSAAWIHARWLSSKNYYDTWLSLICFEGYYGHKEPQKGTFHSLCRGQKSANLCSFFLFGTPSGARKQSDRTFSFLNRIQ